LNNLTKKKEKDNMTNDIAQPLTNLIRIKDVCKMTGLSKSSINRYEGLGDFPKRHRISKGCVVWQMADVQSWIHKKLAGADTGR